MAVIMELRVGMCDLSPSRLGVIDTVDMGSSVPGLLVLTPKAITRHIVKEHGNLGPYLTATCNVHNTIERTVQAGHQFYGSVNINNRLGI